MRHGLRLLTTAFGFCLASLAFADEAADRLQSLQGEWRLTGLEISGHKAEASAISEFSVVVKGDRLTYNFIVSDKPTTAEFKIALPADARPDSIDAELLNGNWKGRTVSGLYQLQGGQLTLCLPDRPEIARPAKIESPVGSDLQVLTLKRPAK